jgi:hypothetical protein
MPMKSILILLASVALLGCTRTHGASKELVVAEAGPKTAEADASSALPESIFSIVLSDQELVLRRAVNGPVLAVTPANDATLYILSAEGTVTPVEPLVAVIAENYHEWWRIGAVAGEWPHALYVETGSPGARVDAIVKNYSLDMESGAIKEERSLREHVGWASPWSGGRTLGFLATDSTFDWQWGRGGGGTFALLAGSKLTAMPILPKETMTNGEFISYESGRIFLVGGIKPKKPLDNFDPDPKMTHIWDFVDGVHATPVEMPGPVRQLLRGRNERESLVVGESYLRRFDGTSWVDVPLPEKEFPPRASIGDDGSVWLISESLGPVVGGVFRASFPELRFERVPLPADHRPTSISARNATDVWLTAVATKSDGGAQNVLLHTQAARPPLVLADRDTRERQALSKKEPAPYTRGCPIPFLALGTDTQLTEADVETFRKSVPDWPFGDGVLGRIHSGKVFGFAVHEIDDREKPEKDRARPIYRTPTALLTAIRPKRPSASILCTKPVVEKRL